jgi:hypothetical protein
MIKIYCKKCGAYLASHNASSVTYKGTVMPTENIDGIIFKCICKRIRTYYFRENTEQKQKNTTSGTIIT